MCVWKDAYVMRGMTILWHKHTTTIIQLECEFFNLIQLKIDAVVVVAFGFVFKTLLYNIQRTQGISHVQWDEERKHMLRK